MRCCCLVVVLRFANISETMAWAGIIPTKDIIALMEGVDGIHQMVIISVQTAWAVGIRTVITFARIVWAAITVMRGIIVPMVWVGYMNQMATTDVLMAWVDGINNGNESCPLCPRFQQ